MRLFVKKKTGSKSSVYKILDELEKKKYIAKPEGFSGKSVVCLYDLNNNEIGRICQKGRIKTCLTIVVGGQIVGTINRRGVSSKYELNYCGWRIEASKQHTYDVYEGNRWVMHSAEPEEFHIGHIYAMDISDEKDEIRCVLLIIAINMANRFEDSLDYFLDFVSENINP